MARAIWNGVFTEQDMVATSPSRWVKVDNAASNVIGADVKVKFKVKLRKAG